MTISQERGLELDPCSRASGGRLPSAWPGWFTTSLSSPTLQEGFAPPEDDEIEEHQQEDQDEY